MANEMKKCIIVSGAPDSDIDFIKKSISDDSFLIAADSGYTKLKKIGVKPDLIIGDFDSSEKPEIDCEIITLPCAKAYTDTFECVQYAVVHGFNHILILNAIGSRIDHTYSNILCLDYCRKQGVYCEIKNKNNRISLICDKRIIKKEYDNFSLFAFLEDCKCVKIKGAGYTAGFYGKESLDISQGDQFGQSNYVSDDECEISLEKGTLLLIESND